MTGVSIRSVREGCAYVPQDNFLFSDTIANNIGFAFDEPDEAAVEQAAVLSDVAQRYGKQVMVVETSWADTA